MTALHPIVSARRLLVLPVLVLLPPLALRLTLLALWSERSNSHDHEPNRSARDQYSCDLPAPSSSNSSASSSSPASESIRRCIHSVSADVTRDSAWPGLRPGLAFLPFEGDPVASLRVLDAASSQTASHGSALGHGSGCDEGAGGLVT